MLKEIRREESKIVTVQEGLYEAACDACGKKEECQQPPCFVARKGEKISQGSLRVEAIPHINQH